MSQIDLMAKVLLADLSNPNSSEDEKRTMIAQAMREYTVECLNLAQYLRDSNVEMEIARGIMETKGISYDGKSKKFK
jgi:hypothetical protein